jgi:hypothetical protein
MGLGPYNRNLGGTQFGHNACVVLGAVFLQRVVLGPLLTVAHSLLPGEPAHSRDRLQPG